MILDDSLRRSSTSKSSSKIPIFNFFSGMSGDVWGVLIYHQWCLGADLEPPVIKIFSIFFSRTSGNVLISILALSDRQTEPSGVDFGPFSFFAIFFYLIGIIGCPFRHNVASCYHSRFKVLRLTILCKLFLLTI